MGMQVSIHLMLLLNFNDLAKSVVPSACFNTSYVVIKPYLFSKFKGGFLVSIHLMLLLNVIGFNNPTTIIFVSIHLMLLLNMIRSKDKLLSFLFQYILCCY